MYAHFKKLIYFSTECIFAPNAYRGHARAFLKDLEKVRPSVIMDIIHSGEQIEFKSTTKMPTRGTCNRCGFVSSQQPCKACVLLEGLNRGLPKLGIGKKSRGDRMIAQQDKELAAAVREKAHIVKNDFWNYKYQSLRVGIVFWILLLIVASCALIIIKQINSEIHKLTKWRTCTYHDCSAKRRSELTRKSCDAIFNSNALQ